MTYEAVRTLLLLASLPLLATAAGSADELTSKASPQAKITAQERIKKVSKKYHPLRMVIAGPGYMWGIDRQVKTELQAAGMNVLSYPDTPMICPSQLMQITSWEQLKPYNVLIFGDPFFRFTEVDPLTGKMPPHLPGTVQLLRKFLDAGGGIFFCGNGEANVGNVDAYNYILKELGLDAKVIGEQVQDPATGVILPSKTGTQKMTWFWTDAISKDPLTEGVKGLWYPNAYSGDGGLGHIPVQVGPEWRVLVKGLATAASYAMDRQKSSAGPTILQERPGTVKASPVLISARQSGKGRVVIWPLWTTFGILSGSADGVGGWLMDGQYQGRTSDGVRLLENLLCWLAEPGQGSRTIGQFDAAKISIPKPVLPDMRRQSGAWYSPIGRLDYPRQFKGLIGVHSNLSDGRSSPEELLAAARQAGYRFMAFTEAMAKMHKAKYETLVKFCQRANSRDASFLVFPGLDLLLESGDRCVAFGMLNWPPSEAFSIKSPDRLRWLYGLTYQIGNTPTQWPPIVIVRSKTNNKRPGEIGFWSSFAPYCYDGGRLVDDSMDKWRPLVGNQGFYSIVDLMAVHTVRSAAEIRQTAQPQFYQTFVRSDNLTSVLDRLRGTTWTRGGSANYISNGPLIEAFVAKVIGGGEGADLSIPQNYRGFLQVKIRSEAGLKEVRIYDRDKLFRRIVTAEKDYGGMFTFHHDSFHVFTLEVIDRPGNKAHGWVAFSQVAERVHRRGGDNWNWMTTGKPRRGYKDYIPWNGFEAFANINAPAGGYGASQADYFHSGLRMTWFNTPLASAQQGGLLINGRHEDRFPSRIMDFETVGRYGIILTNRFDRDMVVREPENYTFREMSGPYPVVPSAWPMDIREFVPEPRFNGTIVARSTGRVRFEKEVATPDGKPIAVSLGITNEYGLNPRPGNQGVLELVLPDGTARRYPLAGLKANAEYAGKIPVNGYLCWYGPDAPGLGGALALSPGLEYTCGKNLLTLFVPTKSPAKPGTQVQWDCLVVSGSADAQNSRQEMAAVRAGMGIVGKPTLYRVEPKIGTVEDQKWSLTLRADRNSFSGTIARTTDQLVPIHLPVMVKGLNHRWDAGIWYRGRTHLEVIRNFRDPWGATTPYRMTGAYDLRENDLQWIPMLRDGAGYCQIDTDKQPADVFIGNFLVCDQPEVFLTLVATEKGTCTFEANNPTDKNLTCTVCPARGFDLVDDFAKTITLPAGGFLSVAVETKQ